MDLFLTQGASVSVSVKDVATLANVSRQTVDQYFNTRSGLLTALTRQFNERWNAQKRYYQAMQSSVPSERLNACINVWLTYVCEIQVLANELNRSRLTDADADAAYTNRVDAVKDLLLDLLVSLKQDGAMREDLERADTVDLVFGIMSPQIYEFLRVDQGWQHTKIVEHLSDVIHRIVLR